MKKFTLSLATIIIIGMLTLTGCNSQKHTIGIIQFGNHPSLNNCYDGIVKGLKEGNINMDDYEIDLKISNFDSSVSAAQANAFSNKNVDIIGAIATPSALAAASAVDGKVPVVYTAISDPKAAGLTTMDNVAGSSDKFDFDNQLKLIREFLPEAKKIGVIYCTAEDNSASQLKTLKQKAPKYGFEIVDVSITNTNEIPTAVDKLISKKIDCINNLTDNTVVGCLDLILEKATNANIPVFGSEVTQVESGCIASASLDYVELGRQTGLYMAKILKGEKIEKGYVIKLTESYLCYNSDVTSKFNISVPKELKMVDVVKAK